MVPEVAGLMKLCKSFPVFSSLLTHSLSPLMFPLGKMTGDGWVQPVLPTLKHCATQPAAFNRPEGAK